MTYKEFGKSLYDRVSCSYKILVKDKIIDRKSSKYLDWRKDQNTLNKYLALTEKEKVDYDNGINTSLE